MSKSKNVVSFIKNNITYIFLVVLFLVSCIASKNFFTPLNLSNLIRQYTPYVLLSLGMLMVILTGGIDLSVGAIVAFTNVITGMLLMNYGWGELPTILVTLAAGTVSGVICGYLVAYRKMAPFIVSLAMMSINQSLSYMITNARVVNYTADFIKKMGIGSFLKIGSVEFPNQLLILVPIVVIIYLIMNRTSYGRLIYAIGSNENAVVLSGINNKAVKMSVYCVCGFLSAMSAILTLSRLTVATANLGSGYELDAIAGCVIGGASLAGGKGSVLKTVAGVFVLALIGNIMNLLAIPSYPQDAIKGVIIIIAVLFQG